MENEQSKTKWGKKMLLISPSLYESYRKLEENKKPYYRDEKASDYRNQINDEKIMKGQIDEKQDLEKQKKAVSELLKPVISDALISNQTLSDKQRIKDILLLVDGLPKIQISDEDIIIDGKKIPLENLVKDLLSEETSTFSYDLNIVLDALLEAKVNPSLIKNHFIKKKLIELEREEARKVKENNRPPTSTESESESDDAGPSHGLPPLSSTRPPSLEKKPYIQQVKLPQPPQVERNPIPQPNFDEEDDVQTLPQAFRTQVQHSPREEIVRPKASNSRREPPPQPRERTPLPAPRAKSPSEEFPFASSKKLKRTPPVGRPKRDTSDSPQRKSARDVPKPKKYGKGFSWEQF